MNKISKLSHTLEECKIRATILHKSLVLSDPNTRNNALTRFRCLPLFVKRDDSYIIQQAKHKHALQVIALEVGFDSWTNLKNYFEKTKLTQFTPHSGYLNHWFAHYKEAKEYLHITLASRSSAFLLPYKDQFFICDASCIQYMGFNPDDPAWHLIGYNWVEPTDMNAWQHLNHGPSKAQKGSIK